jgi:uncharacterized protein (DUF952 family)
MAMIYHLVPLSALRAGSSDRSYSPASLAQEGFVHCADEASVLPVADDYYADVSEPLLLLELDPARLGPETKYEAPAPIVGGGAKHLTPGTLFPHVYGPIELEAVERVGTLRTSPSGYLWPSGWSDLESVIPAAGAAELEKAD